MLLGREDLRVGGFGGGGIGNDVEGGFDLLGYRGEADFGAAGLVAEFHEDVLGAERGCRENGKRLENGDVAGVDVEFFVFGEGEGLEGALGIGDGAEFETGGDFGAQVGGDQVVFGDFAGVNVEAVTNFQDDGDLEGHAACHGIVGGVGFRGDDVFAGGSLRAGS